MHRTDALDRLNHDLLLRYSNRCIERITGKAALTLPLSLSYEHLRDNVEKEARKDRLVLDAAADAHGRGSVCTDGEIAELFVRSKDIDRTFLRTTALPSLSINIRYDDIAEIRMKRFRFLASFAADVFSAWSDQETLSDVIRRVYSAEQFCGILGEILFLYCIETKKLAASVRFFSPFNRAMDTFVDELVEAMEAERQRVAEEVSLTYFPSLPAKPLPRSGMVDRLFPFIRR